MLHFVEQPTFSYRRGEGFLKRTREACVNNEGLRWEAGTVGDSLPSWHRNLYVNSFHTISIACYD